MAFSATEFLPLSAMANSNAPRHWTYTTPDANATVAASGYFDGAVNYGIQVNDLIWCLNANGGTETFLLAKVDAITAGVVTTTSGTIALS